ncbi:MAG TPA: hypothetical protein VGI16_10590 [Candidatus Acidoferrum sp.]|jgi:hypothetical protein
MTTPVAAPDWLTPFLAIWGAFLSSIALGWNLFRDLTDRAKIKVEVKIRRLVAVPGGQWYSVAPNLEVDGASQQLFVVMNAVNARRRPIRLQGWGGIYKNPVERKTGFVIIPRGLPRTINEGDTHSEYTELEANCYPANDTVKRFQIWDSTGRNWKISWLKMRKLRREALAAVANNSEQAN